MAHHSLFDLSYWRSLKGPFRSAQDLTSSGTVVSLQVRSITLCCGIPLLLPANVLARVGWQGHKSLGVMSRAAMWLQHGKDAQVCKHAWILAFKHDVSLLTRWLVALPAFRTQAPGHVMVASGDEDTRQVVIWAANTSMCGDRWQLTTDWNVWYRLDPHPEQILDVAYGVTSGTIPLMASLCPSEVRLYTLW